MGWCLDDASVGFAERPATESDVRDVGKAWKREERGVLVLQSDDWKVRHVGWAQLGS